MRNIFRNSNGKIGFTEPVERLIREVFNTKFGKTNLGYGIIFACAAASNLFTWPLQAADIIAREIDPDHFGPSKEYEQNVETICRYLER